LQLLKQGPMKTNLLPREIVIDRVVRMKKPWTVGALSLLLVGMVTNHATMGRVLSVVDEDKWKGAEGLVTQVSSESNTEKTADTDRKGKISLLEKIGQELSAGASRRVMCLELHKVIEASLNRDPALVDKSPAELPYSDRTDFHLVRVEQKYEADLSKWFAPDVKKRFQEQVRSRRQVLKSPDADKVVPDPIGPTGAGWVIEIKGYHYFNGPQHRGEEGDAHILKYMIEYLDNGKITLPTKEGPKEFTMKEFGVRLPVIRAVSQPKEIRVPNPEYYKRALALGITVTPANTGGPAAGNGGSSSKPAAGTGGGNSSLGSDEGSPTAPIGGGGAGAASGKPNGPPKVVDEEGKEIPMDFPASRCDFIVHFVWKPRFEADGGIKAVGGLPAPGAPAAAAGAAAAAAPAAAMPASPPPPTNLNPADADY
jgi:type IV pilus assembly protein PilM